jgi:hypothetical protein
VSTWFIKGTAVTSTVVPVERAAAEHQNSGVCFRLEAVLGDGDLIGSGGKVGDLKRAVLGMSNNSEVGGDVDRFHGRIGHDSSRSVSHRSCNGAQSRLRERVLQACAEEQSNCDDKKKCRTATKGTAQTCRGHGVILLAFKPPPYNKLSCQPSRKTWIIFVESIFRFIELVFRQIPRKVTPHL